MPCIKIEFTIENQLVKRKFQQKPFLTCICTLMQTTKMIVCHACAYILRLPVLICNVNRYLQRNPIRLCHKVRVRVLLLVRARY